MDNTNFLLTWKAYQVLREGLEISESELEELILFFTQSEKYEICEKLKNK